MPALTKDKRTPSRSGQDFHDPLAAGVKVFAGALVVLDAAGNAKPGETAANLTARGVATECVGTDMGDTHVRSQSGVFRFNNDGSISRADIGNSAFIVDDQTVANDNGGNTRSVAGRIEDVESAGVWVQIG